jgi:hypothetical protein
MEENYINIEDIIIKSNKNNNTTTSNFNDVLVEDSIKIEDYNTNNEYKNKYIYQPQITNINDKLECKLIIVGINHKQIKPDLILDEHDFLGNKLIIIAHLYSNNIIENEHLDIYSIKLNDKIISMSYFYKENNFNIIYKNNKFNKNIKKIDKYLGTHKSIELLIKELSNLILLEENE